MEAEETMFALDVASFAASFVGADILFDSYGAYYAYDKGFYGQSAIYVSAAVLVGATAGQMKLVMRGLKRAELAVIKQVYSQKLVVSTVARGYLYASFLPIVVKLNLQAVISKQLVSVITNKETFLKTVAYANKAEYKSLVQAFEKAAVAENTAFRQMINEKPATVDEFFAYYRQHPTATLDEVLAKVGKVTNAVHILQDIKLGQLVGEGGNKNVYDIIGHPDKVVAILKQGKPVLAIDKEIRLLNTLSENKLPVIEVIEIGFYNGQKALLLKKYAQGSKDVVKRVGDKMEKVGNSPYLNQKSIQDLTRIRTTMIHQKVQIDDLQFLIGKDGSIVIADPLEVYVGQPPSKWNKQMIDKLIDSAK